MTALAFMILHLASSAVVEAARVQTGAMSTSDALQNASLMEESRAGCSDYCVMCNDGSTVWYGRSKRGLHRTCDQVDVLKFDRFVPENSITTLMQYDGRLRNDPLKHFPEQGDEEAYVDGCKVMRGAGAKGKRSQVKSSFQSFCNSKTTAAVLTCSEHSRVCGKGGVASILDASDMKTCQAQISARYPQTRCESKVAKRKDANHRTADSPKPSRVAGRDVPLLTTREVRGGVPRASRDGDTSKVVSSDAARIAELKKHVDDTKKQMLQNLQKVMDRQEKLEDLAEKAEEVPTASEGFMNDVRPSGGSKPWYKKLSRK